MLTEVQCKNARPGVHKDDGTGGTPGLSLIVQPTGKRSWVWRFKQRGVSSKRGLGSYPTVGLADARREAARRLESLRTTGNPDPDQGTATSGGTDTITAGEVIEDWFAAQEHWDPASRLMARRALDKHVLPVIGTRFVRDLDLQVLMTKVIRPIRAHSRVRAHEVTSYLRRAFAHGRTEGLIKVNPGLELKSTRPPRQGNGFAHAKTLEDARAVLRAVDLRTGYPIPKLLHRFIALTAVRVSEAQLAEWDQIEGLEGPAPVWRIPAHQMKMGKRDHIVPLSPGAVDVLRAVRAYRCLGRFCFPGGPDEPLARQSIAVIVKKATPVPHVTHGWRKSFSTIMNDRDARQKQHLVEAALAHAPSGMAGVYDTGDLLDARRVLMTEWADLLLEGAVPLAEIVRMLQRNAPKRPGQLPPMRRAA